MNDDRWAFPPAPPTYPPVPSATPPRRASRVLAATALFVATGVIAAGIGVGGVLLLRHFQTTSSTPTSPTATPGSSSGAAEARALYQQAVTATGASTGFHYVAVSTGGDEQKIVGDAGLTNGRQVITLVSNYGTEQFTLLLVGTTVYFTGNTPALEDQLGVSAATAPNYQNKWISVVNGDGGPAGPYSVLQPGITSASQSTQMPLTATSSTNVNVGGVSAIRISGIVPPLNDVPAGTGSLVIAQSSDLPISYSSSVADGAVVLDFKTTFSAWGTAPTVSPPAGAVAWSTLTTAAPPNGYGGGGVPAGTPLPTPTATPAPI
jgi:hypothetical protein